MMKINLPGTLLVENREGKASFPVMPILAVIGIVMLALLLGMVMGALGSSYAFAIVIGTCSMLLIVWLRMYELTAALIVAVHILVDAYLDFDIYQIALLIALVMLFVCYVGRSTNYPWTGPRLIWLWILFLILNIYPTINGGTFSLTNSIAFYLNLVFSAFIMFWLGNIIAKDIFAVRRVFKFASVLATLIAIHTIIEATTGKFLFQTAQAEVAFIQYSHFHAQGAAEVSRTGSFFINPDGNGIFLVTCFFLPLGLFVESKRFWTKIIYLLETLLILLALIFTYSTGSLIAMSVGVVIFSFMLGHIRYTVLLLTLLGMLTVLAFTVFPSQMAAQLAHANNQDHLSDHMGTWQTAARVIKAYPLFGVGLGDQAYLIRAEPYRALTQSVPQTEPDVSYLQWGATAGIPVMLVFLLLLGYIFRYSWRNWKSIDIRYRSLFGGGVVALIALSINSLVVDGWTSPGGVEYLGWLVAGLVTSPAIGHCLHQQITLLTGKATEMAHTAENSRMGNMKRDS